MEESIKEFTKSSKKKRVKKTQEKDNNKKGIKISRKKKKRNRETIKNWIIQRETLKTESDGSKTQIQSGLCRGSEYRARFMVPRYCR